MPINKNNPIEIPTIVVTPKPWQLAYSALPDDTKKYIYDLIRSRVKDSAVNPHKEEYDTSKKEFEKIGGNYWPDNSVDIINRFDKAITNYHRWDPLNSEEGYQALKDFHDNPGVHMELVTYPYFSRIPISHSEIHGTGPTVNMQMRDEGYNLITNNCSDATKQMIEHIKGVKMPENFLEMTTPNKVRKWAVKTFPTIPLIKGDSVLTGYAFEPFKYEYNPGAVETINRRDTTHDIFPLNITELSRWYNFTR